MNYQKIKGGFMGLLGFILSPLSWWNDALVNIPLAYSCGWIVALFYKPAFDSAFIASYWLTNIAGFVLMHRGICKLKGECSAGSYMKNGFLSHLLLTLAYTCIVVMLLRFHIIAPPGAPP